jgi:imidazolonepropionase-like amidohydrolase
MAGRRWKSLFCALALLLHPAAASAAEELLLVNVHIVDPQKHEVRNGALLIRDGRIVRAPKRTPRDFTGRVLDLEGKWVIPGLTDMHVHSYGNPPADYAPGTAGIAARVLPVGVTGFLDLLGDEDGLYRLREQQRAGKLGGADIFTSLACLTAPGGHCTEYGVKTRTMASPDEARAVVADLARRGPDVIKIVYQPSGTMPSIDKPTLTAAVAEASRQGLRTIVHIGTWEEVRDAVEAGATAVTHVPDPPIPDGLAELMATRGTIWIPTLTVETDIFNFAHDPEVLDNPMARALTTPEVIAAYRTPEFKTRMEASRAEDKARNAMALASVKKAADAGVRILLGTDAGNWGTIQGYSVHRELLLIVEAGLTPWQALAAATNYAGDFLGRRFGVNPGDEANLVVLDASPIADIRNTQRIAMVIHHGKLVDRLTATSAKAAT